MMWQISNLCIATWLSHCLLSVHAASLRQRHRGRNCQIRSLRGRSRHSISYRWEVWGFTCYTETGQRGKGLLHTAGPGFQQDHGPPPGACHWIHCQDTWHQWQWAQIHQGCLLCQCTWNVRRRWVNENYFFSRCCYLKCIYCHAGILGCEIPVTAVFLRSRMARCYWFLGFRSFWRMYCYGVWHLNKWAELSKRFVWLWV